MRIDTTANRHMDDAQLIRYLDQEGGSEERRRWDEHLGSCPRCRGEVETLREESATIAAWLRRADFEAFPDGTAPTRRVPPVATRQATARRLRGAPGGPWLKAAAVVLLVAGPLVAITPTRAWIADQLGLNGAGQQAPSARTATAAADGGTVVRFVPAPGSFGVAFSAAQERGSLVLGRVAAGADAVFEAAGDPPFPEATVYARSIRIRNDAASTASYTILLPPEVTAVRVTVAGQRIDVGAPELDRSAVVRLDRSGDRP